MNSKKNIFKNTKIYLGLLIQRVIFVSESKNMRNKFPQVLIYEEWLELYRLPFQVFFIKVREADGSDGYRRVTQDILDSYPNTDLYIKSRDKDMKEDYKLENSKMRSLRKQVVATLEKYETELKEVEASMLEYVQEYTLEYPPVYMALIADTRNDSANSYLTAKTFWPLMNGMRKEIRIYIGTEMEYADFKSNPKIEKIAFEKIKERLKQRRKDGEL
jgi:hypothetical protein